MPKSQTLREFEQKLARSLREAPAKPTPDCFPEDTLWDFAEQGGKHPDAVDLIRHISSCAYCTQGYFAMKEMLQLRQQLPALAKAGQGVTPPAGASVPNWWKRLHTLLQTPPMRSRVQFGGMALAGGAVTLLLVWPRLTQKPLLAPPDADLTRSLHQSEEDQRHLQAEIAQKSQQAKTEKQQGQETLEKQQQTIQQLWQASGKKTASYAPRTSLILPTPVTFPPSRNPRISSATDSKGNFVYVIPVDPKESRSLRASRLALPTLLASLAKTDGKTMGAPGEEPILLLRPGGTFVSSLRPTFAFKAVPQASKYKLTCIPQKSKANADPISYTIPADPKASPSTVVWGIPSDLPVLEAATTYTWTVEALDAQDNTLAVSSRHEEVLFRTLTVAEMEEIERKRKQYANAPLLMGVLYARLGVLEEAERAFSQDLKANPANTMARRMLRQVQAQQMQHP